MLSAIGVPLTARLQALSPAGSIPRPAASAKARPTGSLLASRRAVACSAKRKASKASPDEEGREAEPLAAAAEEVLFTASQLAGDAAGAASDAADVAAATQAAATEAATDAASDAADVVASMQTAATEAAADVASDAADVAAATQAAATQAAADVASDAADVAASMQAAAADVQQQAEAAVAQAAQAAAATAEAAASSIAKQLSAPEPPAGALRAPSPPAGSLSAPKPPAGAISAPEPPAGALGAPAPPAGSLQAPAQPAASLPLPPATPPPSGGGGGGEGRAAQIHALKEQLVAMLASLDRGAAATADQVERVSALAHRLEVLGGAVELSWEKPAGGGKPTMALLDGRWRLLYSSGFASGSLGGRRPGPSIGSLPVTLGQVFQDVCTDKSELDNVVDLFARFSLASLPGLNASVPTATARLRHSFQILGPATVEITFNDTEVRLAGGLAGWLDRLPQLSVPKLPDFLQPPKSLRSARFDVVFLDEQLRITRGDRGELRVFIKGEA